MVPKEKAEKLVLRFMYLQEPNYNWFHKGLGKQCALIAVDEILICCIGSHEEYWQEVKQEIEKL
jgi:hypothetical protein